MFAALGKNIMPEKIRGKIKNYIIKTGKKEVPYGLYGLIFIISLIFTIGIYFLVILPTITSAQVIMILLISFLVLTVTELVLVFLIIICFWLFYEFVIFKRTRKIEEVLPDFLEQVSVNLRAGMSFDKALWQSIQPEFGVLKTEIQIVAKKVMAGEDTEQALKEFSNKYSSTLLEESIDMIIIGLRSGGNVSDLIDRIVKNVKEASYLNKELIASVTSYIIFISVVAVVVSPILFALSFNLMQIIQSLGEKLSTSSSTGILSLNFGDNKLDPKDFILFSKLSVMIIAGMSSMIIADLREGSIKAGMKYVFMFVPISFFIYVIMLNVLSGIFGVLG